MKTIRTLLGAAVVAVGGAMLALNSGCILAAAGEAAGTVAFVEGKFIAHVSNPYDRVERAAAVAIKDMQFALVSEKRDALTAEFTARTAKDTKVVVAVYREGDNLTRIEIRVGVFGDKQVSMLIFDRIRGNL
jgi:Protein of unknown function (DUF3568)